MLTAWEVPPPAQTEVAATETPADAVADTVPEREPVPADSAGIRLDASDPNLAVWQDREISGDPPREPGPIEVGSVLTFFGLPIARTPEDVVAEEVEVAFLRAPVDVGWGTAGRVGSRPRSVPCGARWAAWRRWLTVNDATPRRVVRFVAIVLPLERLKIG